MLSNIGISEAVVVLFVLVPAVILVVALVDILKSNFEGNNKLIWTFIVIVLPVIGAILYFTIGKEQKI